MSQRLKLFSDGGARGNPGPAAIAFVALNDKSETVKTQSCFIGVHTNNQAEYEALILALQFAHQVRAEEVVCHLDSELVVKQLNREYTVKNYELQQYWRRVQDLTKFFKKVIFVNVPRSNLQIQKADALVNRALDEEARKRFG